VTQGTPPARTDGSKLPPFDPTVPNPARMWNYWLGGKDNFAADRQAAERVLEVMPSLPLIARAARLFLIDAVHQLAAEHGIRQFLDIGTGLPTADNTHDVAQRAAPESKIVYVDYDPVVLTHAQALLTSSPEGQTDYIQADLRDTDTIVKGAARTLDLTRPVAILLIAVLHFIPDADDPYAVVARLMDAVPSGSYLVIAHAAADIAPEASADDKNPLFFLHLATPESQLDRSPKIAGKCGIKASAPSTRCLGPLGAILQRSGQGLRAGNDELFVLAKFYQSFLLIAMQ